MKIYGIPHNNTSHLLESIYTTHDWLKIIFFYTSCFGYKGLNGFQIKRLSNSRHYLKSSAWKSWRALISIDLWRLSLRRSSTSLQHSDWAGPEYPFRGHRQLGIFNLSKIFVQFSSNYWKGVGSAGTHIGKVGALLLFVEVTRGQHSSQIAVCPSQGGGGGGTASRGGRKAT